MSSELAFLLIKSRGTSRTNLNSGDKVEKIPIYSNSVVLGRHPYCNIVLDNAAVSREHTRIEHSPKGFTIEDLQSRNGTWLNGEQLVRKSFLYNGDVVRICDMVIVFSSSLPEAKRPSKEESCLGSQTVIINNDSLQDLTISSRINVHDSHYSRQISGCGDYIRQISNLQNKIDVLTSFSKNLGKASKPSELLPRFLDDLLALFPQADYACLLAPNSQTKKLEISYFKRRDSKDLTPIHISRSLLETVIQTKNGILSEETRPDDVCNRNVPFSDESSSIAATNENADVVSGFGKNEILDVSDKLGEEPANRKPRRDARTSKVAAKKSETQDPALSPTALAKKICETGEKAAVRSFRFSRRNDSDKPLDEKSNRLQKYSTMAVPILDISKDDEVLGVLKLDSFDFETPFAHDDLDLLIAVANQAAVCYENAKFQEMRLQESMLTQEMTVAHKVQKGFLPAAPPQIPHYDFFDYYKPAKYLGGDYFDYISLPDGRLAIALGDVSGKGISASLLMAQLSSEVRYSLLLEKTFPKTVERLNRVYSENHWDNRFITFLLAVLDPATHRVHLVNAGHVFPILSRCDGEIQELGDGYQGFPLGIVPDACYQEFVFDLKSGEFVSIMSDGVTDAMNDQDDFFGLDRVRSCLKNSNRRDASELGENLLDQVRTFAGTVPQTDDQCLVVFGRK